MKQREKLIQNLKTLIDKIMQTAQKLNAQNEEELKSEAAHKKQNNYNS